MAILALLDKASVKFKFHENVTSNVLKVSRKSAGGPVVRNSRPSSQSCASSLESNWSKVNW